ncbi:MFS transporter [Cupriavidus pinatubonensis]|uniref:MFS transporter n=1 Tax=Cupriavidus pinatubonensis TaxID=248026 RepID=UPI0011296F0B|nr:MFS transporter [Cupriavidus pinatubonensis]TPQ37981.1 MFS transporter [Cupriavidus pinatubonensis]
METIEFTPLPTAHRGESKHQAAKDTSVAERKQSLKAAAVGNVLEWYDWTIYSTFSVYLAGSFFSKSDPTSAFLSTLAIFAGGFLARPLGGYIFGRMADGKGRKLALVTTMIMLAATSLGIALLPNYAEIGSWASLGLFLMRLLQGFAHGGESGVSYVYIAEIAPRERRGFWASSVYISVILGVMLATGVAAALSALLTKEDMGEWGWRIGFALGAVLGLYALFMRRKAVETDTYVALNAKNESKAPTEKLSKRTILRFSLLVIALNAGMNVWYYIWVAFAPAMAISAYNMDPKGAYTSSLIAQAITLIFIPIFGYMSDRIGRRRTLMTFAVLVGVMAIPIQSLLSNQPWTLLLAQGSGLIIWTIGVGQYPALMAELVPARVRGVGVGILTSLAIGLFGGTAPYLNTWLRSIGADWAFQAYIIVLAIITVVAAYRMKETAGMDLRG